MKAQGKNDLADRAKAFSLDIICMSDALPHRTSAQVLGKQVLRSATSIGANYREASRGRSKPEFIAKVGDCLREAEETGYWLELLEDSRALTPAQSAPLLDECRQYLDTSVIGGYFDEEWWDATRELFRQTQSGKFHFVSSDLVVREVEDAPENVRTIFEQTFSPEQLLRVVAEMEDLADAYLKQRVVSPAYADDARHVAICTVARIDYLVSWNFQHLVNVQREAGFNAVNLLQGYPPVRIVSPLELIHGSEDENV